MSLYYYIYCEKTFLTVFNLNFFTESCNFSLLVILNEKIEMSNTHSHTQRLDFRFVEEDICDYVRRARNCLSVPARMKINARHCIAVTS